MTQIFCLIPARLGSKRLPKKNLRELGGVPLLARAIRKAFATKAFDQVWVSSESDLLGDLAISEGAQFHQRAPELGSDEATSEDFVADFLAGHDCDWVVQLHSISPLFTVEETKSFVAEIDESISDAIFSVVPSRLEVLHAGKPLNFEYHSKTNSQDLEPVYEICWAITAWRRTTFMAAQARGECATYSGQRKFVVVSALSAHAIKTELDLKVAEALLPLAAEGGHLA